MPRFIQFLLPIAVLTSMMSCTAEKQEDLSRLPMEGAENFRSLGGYKTEDGRIVKEGVLYRSGHLHDLTKADAALLHELEISMITDFRGPSEIEDEPDAVPDGISYKSYPIDIAGSDLRDKIISVIKGDSDMNMTAYMVDINRQFARDYTETYSQWIHALVENSESVPQVFHCTAGKDRAGFAAAILLRTLGVPYETVMSDYLKSNDYNAEYIEKTIKKIRVLSLFKNDGEVIRPLLTVDPQYLQTAFDTIDTEWDSFSNYIHQGLKLSDADIESLKNR
ncbi:MAG: tyrosine-protein phosphatase, partial [Spirochaetaceae bacterium]|nr:tyrosine-protein phosphatase [Spirochaetaceae bacterium]